MLKAINLHYKTILKKVYLEFVSGAIHVIIGPNGAGKTTFLKLVTGIWPLTEGSVLWQEENLLEKSRREISTIITFVPQNPHIAFDFSVEQFLDMGLYAHRNHINKFQKIEAALESVDASHLRKRSLNTLSQGERQRIYLARAFITEAPILALDEPLANLDIKYQKAIWKLLKVAADQGKTVIVSCHDLKACEMYSDFSHVFIDGSAVSSGKSSEIIPSYLSEFF